jgi:hypothetical protein
MISAVDPMAEPGTERQFAFRTRKVLAPDAIAVDPQPLFVNFFEIARIGSDVFMDVGFIPPEQFLGMKDSPPTAVLQLDFLVSRRLVMSPDALRALYTKVGQILGKIEEVGVHDEAEKP